MDDKFWRYDGVSDPRPSTDIWVATANPPLLEQTLQGLPGVEATVVVGSYDGEKCKVAVTSGLGFLRFALERQGYGQEVSGP